MWTLWTIIAAGAAFAVGWLIKKYSLADFIRNIIANYDKFEPAITKVVDLIVDSMRPDEDGGVTLTPEEITAIKEALKELLALFGVEVPFIASLHSKL